MAFSPAKLWRNTAAAILAISAFLIAAPSFADKPASVLPSVERLAITAIPIDFDRDDPDRKQFGKLVWRGGINLYAKSPFFGGYSALIIGPSGKSLLAISDAGTWLRANIDYDGRKLKGLSGASIGPILGRDGKPLAGDAQQDSEGLALIDGDTSKGTAYVAFERNHRVLRYPFTSDRFGPPDGGLTLPAETKRMSANRGIEAIVPIRVGRLKGTTVLFSERLPDKNGNLRGWLIGGPTPGAIALKNVGGFDITDAAALPDGGILVLERRFRYSEGVKMRIRRIGAKDLKPGALISGEVLLEASDSSEHRQYGGDRRAPRGLWRDRPHADLRRQFQRAAADASDAIRAARRQAGAGRAQFALVGGGSRALHLGDVALEAPRFQRQFLIAGLEQISVEPAAMLDRT